MTRSESPTQLLAMPRCLVTNSADAAVLSVMCHCDVTSCQRVLRLDQCASDPDFTMHSGDFVVPMPQLNMSSCDPECWSINAMRDKVYFMAGELIKFNL
jgi:hypothetical protein